MSDQVVIVIYCENPEEKKDELAKEFEWDFKQEQHGSGPIHWSVELGKDLLLELYPVSDKSNGICIRCDGHVLFISAEDIIYDITS